jgi:hypothetical protein
MYRHTEKGKDGSKKHGLLWQHDFLNNKLLKLPSILLPSSFSADVPTHRERKGWKQETRLAVAIWFFQQQVVTVAKHSAPLLLQAKCDVALQAAKMASVSSALFAPAWTYENFPGTTM